MTQKSDLPSFLLEHAPWTSSASPIWLATAFVLQRNLSSYNFPSTMEERDFVQSLNLLKESLFKVKELESPQLLKAEEISATDKEFIYEHFLCLESFNNTLVGQGFVVDSSAQFLGLVNVFDHLQLQILDWKGEWEKTWDRLSKIEASLNSTLDFAYSSRFGYLASDFAFCGTGLLAFAYLHLPALIHTKQLEEVLIKQKTDDIHAFGMEGNLQELIGDLVILRNAYTLGVSEENILHSLQSNVIKLVASEKAMRTHLKEHDNVQIKDEVSRAYGLLVHSYQLLTKEALGALSLLKLALDLGWVEGISDGQLNALYFQCRHAHLSHFNKEEIIDPQIMARKRAEYLHEKMKGIALKI